MYFERSILSIATLLLFVTFVDPNTSNEEPKRACNNRPYDGIPALCDFQNLQGHNDLWDCLAAKLEGNNVIQVSSSQSNTPFQLKILPILGNIQSSNEKLLDINTTMYVSTNEIGHTTIKGFGVSLDLKSLMDGVQDWTRTRDFSLLAQAVNDLADFGYLSLVRLDISQDCLANQLSEILQLIDSLSSIAGSSSKGPRISLILNLKDTAKEPQVLESLERLTMAIENSHAPIDVYGVLKEWPKDSNLTPFYDALGAKPMVDCNCNAIDTCLHQIDHHNGTESSQKAKAVVVDTEFGNPLGHWVNLKPLMLGDLLAHESGASLHTEKRVPESDWQEALYSATHMLKLLESGFSGFMNSWSPSSLEKEGKEYQSPFSLQDYIRSPKMCAFGHIARYIKPGSQILIGQLVTQPNMFAASYLAFETPEKHVGIVVVNNNEHLLPFRLAINERIIMRAELEPKSINTFLTKP